MIEHTNNTESSFEERKQQYFTKLGLQYRRALQLHKPTLWGEKKTMDDWRNVSHHCLVVAARCKVLAEKLHMDSQIIDHLVEAAIVHDAHKKAEIELVKQANETGKKLWAVFEQSGEESAKILADNNINPVTQSIAPFSGHGSLKRIQEILKKETLTTTEIAQLIMYYTDAISQNDAWCVDINNPNTLETQSIEANVLDYRLATHIDAPKYSRLHDEGLEHIQGKTFDVMREVGHSIEQKLSGIFQERTNKQIISTDWPSHIDQWITEAITQEN